MRCDRLTTGDRVTVEGGGELLDGATGTLTGRTHAGDWHVDCDEVPGTALVGPDALTPAE